MKKMAACLALVMLVGCGEDGNNTNNTNNSNNTSTNNTSTNNNTNNNTNNTSTNNTSTNNTSTNNTSTNNNTNNVPCGDITFEGQCDGAVLLFCTETDGLIEIDCAEAGAATVGCEVIPDFGADCVVAVGDSCYIAPENPEEAEDFFFCSGANTGCVWEDTDYVCKDNQTACDFDTFVAACDGNIYYAECSFGQPIGIDCVSIGGLCDDNEGCLVALDGYCDDFYATCSVGECAFGDEFYGVCEEE